MKWNQYVQAAENILSSRQVPSSLDIITLIKKVNPTRLTLSEADRERGYRLKNRLQSLLLEHYGDTFLLVPHPASPNIILIKHRDLPLVDACHADVNSLSTEAIERVELAAPLHTEREETAGSRSKGHGKTGTGGAAKEILKKAQALLDEFDYAAAEEELAGLRIRHKGEIPVLARAAATLLHEMGAYQRCIDILLSQPLNVLKARGIREILAVAYHRNGSLPEARAILDELHPAELGREALLAYAHIAFKDGNLSVAWELMKSAQGKEGVFTGPDTLEKDIEAAMSAQAEPVAQKAVAAFQSSALDEAGRLAREALELYPNCRKAREVIAGIEAIANEAQLAELWARVESEPAGERRIALLTTLLERDRERREEIKKLIAEEKARQRRILFDEQLEALRTLVLQERWPESFDLISSLMRQPEFGERACELLALSPFFPVLHDNRLLDRAGDRARELWLRFVKTKLALAAGNEQGCFESLAGLRPWFKSSREFHEDYLVLLRREQQRARTEIALLLQQGEAAERPTGDPGSIYATVKKRMRILPEEERRALARTVEERLTRLVPEPDPGQLLEEYREALQIGNSEKAGRLRHQISDSAAMDAVDAEIADSFRIGFEPVALLFSDHLPVDLTTPPPLQLRFISEHAFFLQEGPDTLIMIDFLNRVARRLTAPLLGKMRPMDISLNDTFVFAMRNEDNSVGETLWRAEISVERARFTAKFDMKEWFEIEDGFTIGAVYLSGDRDTEYFVGVKDDEGRAPAKVLKKRLAPKTTVETLQLWSRTDVAMSRLTDRPDRFLLNGEGSIRVLNRNLSLKASLALPPKIYGIDGRNGHVYVLEDGWLTERDHNLSFIKSYESARSIAIYGPERYHGISYETDTALIVLGDGKRQAFYNLRNNKFSNKIRTGRVIPSMHDGKWYCFDYKREEGTLRLRDITQDIHKNLEWKEFFVPQAGRKKMLKKMMWFHEDDNFVYRPEEWEVSDGVCW